MRVSGVSGKEGRYFLYLLGCGRVIVRFIGDDTWQGASEKKNAGECTAFGEEQRKSRRFAQVSATVAFETDYTRLQKSKIRNLGSC